MKDRFKEIIKLCTDQKISVNELIDHFDVSASTIRRDLVELEDKGIIKRTHGYVMLNPEQAAEESNEFKTLYMAKEKELIARYAASLVKDGDIVYIDAGTTTSRIIEFIAARNIMIVTHSLDCVEKSKDRNFDIFMVGGNYKKKTNTLVGNETIAAINNISVKIAFIAANAVHPLNGISCPDETESNIKKSIMNRSIKSYMCIDSSKFNQLKKSKICDLKNVNLITDKKLKDFDYSLFNEVVFVKDLL